MKKLPALVVVFSLLLITCELFDEILDTSSKKFWAQNTSTSRFYQVNAELLYEGTYCKVWAEKGSGATYAQAQSIAIEYDTKIYQKMINAFGFTSVTIDETNYDINTMEYADALSKDPDGKLCILLLDIKDDYKAGVNESYVAGYFWPGDLLSGYNSNYCDMIYIDTDPGLKTSTADAYSTLAHEMQHLMNFVSSVVYRSTKSGPYTVVTSMDIWIDEGLSSAAEWLYLEKHPEIKWKWYNLNGDGKEMKGLINKGNNFFVWGNRKENQYAVLDDYATVYLFFQWLRLQTGNTSIYKSIITSKDNDFNAVTNAIDEEIPGEGYSDWKILLKTWLAANHINAETGAYGYKKENVLKDIKAPAAPGGDTSIILYPGEGVYSSVTSSTSIPAAVGNINYAGLNGSMPVISGSISSGVLLTYNVNKIVSKDSDGNAIGEGETGAITGENPPSANIVSVFSNSRSTGFGAGPFPISAGDMLRRNGKNSLINSDGLILNIPSSYKGIIVNEK